MPIRPILVSVFFLLFSVPSFAQPKAVIKGPTESLAGTLTFLSSEAAVGDNKVWIIPDEMKNASSTCGSTIFFSIPTPGIYKFGLIVADKQANIDYTFHQIIVKGSTTTPVDPPTGPIDPIPGQFTKLKTASSAGIKQLQDWPTTTSMKNSLSSALTVTKSLPLSEKIKTVQATVGAVLGGRSNESYRTKDWETLWRIPINKELVLLPPDQYQQAMEVVVETLVQTP